MSTSPNSNSAVVESVKASDEVVGPFPEFHEGLEIKEAEAISTIVRREVVTAIRHEMHSGPMPPPSQLEEYERVLPGTAQAIRDEFQANGRHIREMEKTALSYQKDDNDRNRSVAERLVWGALIASAVLGYTGHWQIATVLAATTIGAVITGFLVGKRSRAPTRKTLDDSDEE